MDQWNKTMAVVATSAVGTKTKKTRNNQRTARQNKAKKKGGNVLVQDVESQRQWREARLDRLEDSYDLILDTTLNDELNLSDEHLQFLFPPSMCQNTEQALLPPIHTLIDTNLLQSLHKQRLLGKSVNICSFNQTFPSPRAIHSSSHFPVQRHGPRLSSLPDLPKGRS